MVVGKNKRLFHQTDNAPLQLQDVVKRPKLEDIEQQHAELVTDHQQFLKSLKKFREMKD